MKDNVDWYYRERMLRTRGRPRGAILNPAWVALDPDFPARSFRHFVYTRRIGVKPSKYRRRVRHLSNQTYCLCIPFPK